MFSLSKLLALIGIIGAVLYGYRLYNRLQETRSALDETKRSRDAKREAHRDSGQTGPTSAKGARDKSDTETVDLVRDEKTGAFVPRDRTDTRS
jgi:hypothetical protein